jgi:hypothetical protein
VNSSDVASGNLGARFGGWTEARLVTWILVAFLVWIPLQTPVAVLAHQYLHVSDRIAQGILLLKDVWAAGLIVVLGLKHLREIRFRWFDWSALAFVALVGLYSFIPTLLGSRLPAMAIISSARELLVPVELYCLGRLAGYAGVSALALAKAFVVAAAGAAVFSVGAFLVLPQSFWQTGYNLVGFVHDVQGITSATSLWAASLVGAYGDSGQFLRATGPFTHPVGTAVYFSLPLVLAVCAAWTTNLRRTTAAIVVAGGLVLFGLAVLTPISRGIWIGFLLAVAVLGVTLRKYRLAVVTVVVFCAIVVLVAPFKYALSSAADGSDGSAVAHGSALWYGIDYVLKHPLGGGVGQGDQYGSIYAAGSGVSAAGVGENMYLMTYASVGPFGLLAVVAFFAAMLWETINRVRESVPVWVSIGVGAGLLASLTAAMTASTLMRFTTAASIWLLVGVVVAAPATGQRITVAELRQRFGRFRRSAPAEPA